MCVLFCGLTLPITGLRQNAKRAVAIPVDWRVRHQCSSARSLYQVREVLLVLQLLQNQYQLVRQVFFLVNITRDSKERVLLKLLHLQELGLHIGRSNGR